MSKGIKNFGSLIQKLGEILGVKKNFPTHSPKIVMFNFPKFLHMSLELNCLKTLKIWLNSIRLKLVKLRILYFTRMPGYIVE